MCFWTTVEIQASSAVIETVFICNGRIYRFIETRKDIVHAGRARLWKHVYRAGLFSEGTLDSFPAGSDSRWAGVNTFELQSEEKLFVCIESSLWWVHLDQNMSTISWGLKFWNKFWSIFECLVSSKILILCWKELVVRKYFCVLISVEHSSFSRTICSTRAV